MAAPLIAALIVFAASWWGGSTTPVESRRFGNLFFLGAEAEARLRAGGSLRTGPLAKLDGVNGRPFLASMWRADFRMYGEGRLPNGTGTYWYDREGQRSRQTMKVLMEMFQIGAQAAYDVLYMNRPGFNHNMTVGEGADAVCKPMVTGPYLDAFDGLEKAKKVRSDILGGECCTVWSFNSSDGLVSNSVCLSQEGLPLDMNTTSNIVLGRSVKAWSGMTRLVFENAKVKELADSEFANSAPCAQNYPTKPCKDEGVATLNVYRFRSPKEPNELVNRNTGDALGDMAFVCMKDADAGNNNSVVTHWKVSASRAWGQYAYCLYSDGKNSCLGGTGKQAGRESAFGMGTGHLQGQCSENKDIGSWYSFPAAGLCRPGQQVGSEGCSWGNAVALRTVHARCIFHERGLLEACNQERGHAPYVRSARILEAALASSDPALGGCPDADVASEEAVYV